ncbi:protein white-like [Saccoglossus kowalevskii]
MASMTEIKHFWDLELTPVSEFHKWHKQNDQYMLTWLDVQATALPPSERWFDKLKRFRVKDIPEPKPMTVLHGVSGLAEPGKIIAIMGASGSGKTTLLNTLSGRPHLKGNLLVEGLVLANGSPVTEKFSKRNMAYVEQTDLFIPSITAREHLNFHAILRMDRDTSPKLRVEKINTALIQLGLGECSEEKISQLSGGEKKRLSFAAELLTDPSLMLCDEPTCGLDSFMAGEVMKALKGLAAQGKTIITTIHQPPSAVYDLCDSIFLLVEGRCAYFGPTVRATQYFADIGFLCPYTFSPPDFFILLLSVIPDQEESSKQRFKTICDAYEDSKQKTDFDTRVLQLRINELPCEDETDIKAVLTMYKATWWTQFKLLLYRSCVSVVRNQASLKTRLPSHIIAGLFFGLCYLVQKNKGTVQNISGYLALMLILLASETVFSVVQIIPMEVPVFFREHHNGMYNAATYFISRVLSEIPPILLIKTVYVAVSYYMVGLNPDFGRFMGCCAIVIITSGVGFAFGIFVSMTSENITIVLSISQSILLPMIIVGGIFIQPDSIPAYMFWLKYTSWFYYGFGLLNINEWTDRAEVDCSTDTVPNCVTSGKNVLHSVGYSQSEVTGDVIALSALFFGYLLLGYLVLLWKLSSKHPSCRYGRCGSRG